MSTPSPPRIGFIAADGIARERHLPGFREVLNVELYRSNGTLHFLTDSNRMLGTTGSETLSRDPATRHDLAKEVHRSC
jgi:hypothetical protein